MRLIGIIIVAYFFQLIGGLSAISPTFLAIYLTEPNIPTFVHWLGVSTQWIAGPVFSGFVAVHITFKLFKEKDVTRISTPYISSLFTLLAVWLLFVSFNFNLFKWSVIVQSSMVILGAYLAQKTLLNKNNASNEI